MLSFPGLEKWIDFLIGDCISGQTEETYRMDTNTVLKLDFAENVEGFNPCLFKDTEGPIRPFSKGITYIFVACDAFTQYVITKSSPQIDAETAADVISEDWITVFWPVKNFLLHIKARKI